MDMHKGADAVRCIPLTPGVRWASVVVHTSWPTLEQSSVLRYSLRAPAPPRRSPRVGRV